MIIDRFTGTVVPRKAIVCIVCWLAGPKKSVLNSPISFATGGRWPATSLVRSANSTPSKSSIYIYTYYRMRAKHLGLIRHRPWKNFKRRIQDFLSNRG